MAVMLPEPGEVSSAALVRMARKFMLKACTALAPMTLIAMGMTKARAVPTKSKKDDGGGTAVMSCNMAYLFIEALPNMNSG